MWRQRQIANVAKTGAQSRKNNTEKAHLDAGREGHKKITSRLSQADQNVKNTEIG